MRFNMPSFLLILITYYSDQIVSLVLWSVLATRALTDKGAPPEKK
jgi:hypothetical protein